MPGESLSFPILAEDRASSKFRDVGNAALGAAGKIGLAAGALKLWDDTAIKQGRAATTSAGALKAHAKAASLLADAENVLAGRATKTTKLIADQGTQAAKAAAGFGTLIGTRGGAGGMVGAIAAGVALSPVAATLALGLGGLAIAALGAGKNTNLFKQGLAQAKPELLAFQKSLQPQVLGIFNAGIKLAGGLLHDIQPVAKATGTALTGVLGAVGKEFRGGTWQKFFGFMRATAAPDVKLLGGLFVSLLHDIPPLVESLQPLAVGILSIATVAAKAVGGLEKVHVLLPAVGLIAGAAAFGPLGAVIGGILATATELTKVFSGVRSAIDATIPSWTRSAAVTQFAGAQLAGFGPKIAGYVDWLHKANAAGESAAVAQQQYAQSLRTGGHNATTAAAQLQATVTAVNKLSTAQSAALANQNTYASDLVTTATDARALEKALDASKGKIGLHTAAELASFGAANTYIASLSATAQQARLTGHNIDGSITAIRNGLPILESATTRNRAYWAEVKTLVGWLHQLELIKAIRETVFVTGNGTFTVRPGTKVGLPGGSAGGPFAAGGLVTQGTTPTADNVIARVSKGELIVPAHMVKAGAVDHLRGSIPGFASGGLIPSYSGTVAGLAPWSRGDLNATVRLFEQAVAKATFAGMKAAAHAAASFGGGGGPGGGSPSANAALARRLFPQWSTGPAWAAWNYVAMRESGWNQFARNPSSGAYGIPQALPPTKLPFAGQAAGGSNPTAQIRWMAAYMSSRYGGPVGAAQHEAAFNWYDRGGWLPPGVSMAVNTTGRPEHVGPVPPVVIEFRAGSEGRLITTLLELLRHEIRIRGGNVQAAIGRA